MIQFFKLLPLGGFYSTKLFAINIAIKMSESDDGSLIPIWTDPQTSRACKNNQKKENILWISQNSIKDIR